MSDHRIGAHFSTAKSELELEGHKGRLLLAMNAEGSLEPCNFTMLQQTHQHLQAQRCSQVDIHTPQCTYIYRLYIYTDTHTQRCEHKFSTSNCTTSALLARQPELFDSQVELMNLCSRFCEISDILAVTAVIHRQVRTTYRRLECILCNVAVVACVCMYVIVSYLKLWSLWWEILLIFLYFPI